MPNPSTSPLEPLLSSVQSMLASLTARFKDNGNSSLDSASFGDRGPGAVEGPSGSSDDDDDDRDPIRGTAGDDDLRGTNDDDIIRARSGDDVIDAKDGSDIVEAGSGDDDVDAGDGDDRVSGGSGDDKLAGGEGDDTLRAGSGDDKVEGGEGDDRITLGSGEDTVVYAGKIDDDVITDFKTGIDVIDLTAFTDITSLDQLVFTQDGPDTVISAPGIDGTITVKNISFNELKDGGSVLVACYLAGTMIETPDGEKSIDTLSIGDLVTTVDGAARPIKWIGHRAYASRFLKPQSRMWPVTIRVGALGATALGDPMPVRDLTVSPGHSLLIDGKLVNADLLLNGTSVVRTHVAPTITYYHLELETPDAIIANGTPSETYVNDANRAQFQNAESYVMLYGADHPAERLPTGQCKHAFPHVADGAELNAVREAVNARALLNALPAAQAV